jgi:hypothetical protein
MTTTASSILQRMKEHDPNNIGVVTLVTQDTIYERLMAAWPNVARLLKDDPDPDEVCPPDTPSEFRILWLWSRIEPEPEPLWATVAGLPYAPHVARAMYTLRDHAAVFPDGTMSDWLNKYLVKVASRVGVKRDEPEEATT